MSLFKDKNPSRGTQGKTLMHEAASLGCLQTLMIVQEQVENINPKDKLGRFISCKKGRSEDPKYSHDSIISTVSIKRTIWIFLILSLLNVPYDLILERLYCLISIVFTK